MFSDLHKSSLNQSNSNIFSIIEVICIKHNNHRATVYSTIIGKRNSWEYAAYIKLNSYFKVVRNFPFF